LINSVLAFDPEKLVLPLSSVPAAMQSAGKLLPPQIHEVVLEGELERKGRVIIIGDVHGCIKEMKELLVMAEYIHGVDTVILVGDLGDKGPKPLEVGPQSRERCMGSHVVYCLQWSVLLPPQASSQDTSRLMVPQFASSFTLECGPIFSASRRISSTASSKGNAHAPIQDDAGGYACMHVR